MVMKALWKRMKGFDMPINMLAIIVVFIIVAFIIWYAISKFKLV